jgi:hypothetical protein
MGSRQPLATTVVVFLVFTLIWIWPLLAVFGRAYLEQVDDPSLLVRADSLLTTRMLAWGAHAMRTDPLHLFHANIL